MGYIYIKHGAEAIARAIETGLVAIADAIRESGPPVYVVNPPYDPDGRELFSPEDIPASVRRGRRSPGEVAP